MPSATRQHAQQSGLNQFTPRAQSGQSKGWVTEVPDLGFLKHQCQQKDWRAAVQGEHIKPAVATENHAFWHDSVTTIKRYYLGLHSFEHAVG